MISVLEKNPEAWAMIINLRGSPGQFLILQIDTLNEMMKES